MEKFTESVPPDSRAEFTALVNEDKAVTKPLLQATLEVAEVVARTMFSGVDMSRSSWLQASGLLHEDQLTIPDLPFEGPALFSSQTNSKLHSLKDFWVILKSLGLHSPATQRKQFKPKPIPQFYQGQPRQE